MIPSMVDEGLRESKSRGESWSLYGRFKCGGQIYGWLKLFFLPSTLFT